MKNHLTRTDVLIPEAEFRSLLLRERARTDRTGRAFSLVLLGPWHEVPGGIPVHPLCRLMAKRMRATDEAGWFDKDRPAVLLPETPAEGARAFARNLVEAAAPFCPHLPWELITYPEPSAEASGKGPDRPGQEAPSGRQHPSEVLLGAICAPLPAWKRALDVVLSSLALAILSPLLLLTALFIKLVSPGPVFYRHERIGRLGRPFMMFKFRTMHVGSEKGGHRAYFSGLINGEAPMVKLEEGGRDQRLIPLGRALRRSCVDELPNLFNVLRGEMSLVGPRPCLRYELEEYAGWHRGRLDALPGMTGLWQVSGKNRTTFRQMVAYDIRYGRSQDLLSDLAIIARTPRVVLEQVAGRLLGK